MLKIGLGFLLTPVCVGEMLAEDRFPALGFI